jgi:L-iditol 2-dehydrogenase
MKALVYTAPKTLEYRDAPKPEIGIDEVLLKIKNIGICGTDLHIYNGGMNTPIPLIMGHEFSGIIEEVGSNVSDFKIGDRVVGEHVIPCKKCKYCLEGKPNLCSNAKVIGLDFPGALAEYVAIPKNLVYKIPDTIPFDEAALIEPLTIALYATKEAGNLLDKNVAIIGQGPIGLLLDQVVKTAGGNVIGIETQESRLNFAKGKGWIDTAINAKTENVSEVIAAKYPYGIDIVFEVVGAEVTAEMALDIASKEGHVFLLGVFEKLAKLDLMKIVKKELHVHGSWTCAFSFPEAIDLVSKGKIDLKSLISHHFKLGDGAKAFLDSSEYKENRIKTVIEV